MHRSEYSVQMGLKKYEKMNWIQLAHERNQGS
jgi:hypothetical protein